MTGYAALYIHVPFCRRKCGYCSFVSFPGRETDIDKYASALCEELTRRSGGDTLFSVYFGGGTPGLLSLSRVKNILDAVTANHGIDTHAELSFETNPGIVDEAYLAGLRLLGINRLSLGIQSFDDRELALLGRIHTAGEARDAVAAARRAGFKNLNIDLIYGIPGQTSQTWRETLREAVRLGPEHISLYALTLEPDCPMAREIDSGCIPGLDGDIAADMYEMAEDILAAAGYRHYEISNWAKPGYECRHNLVYWKNQPYLGLGVAAHSSLDGRRIANTSDLDVYLAARENGILPEPELDEEIPPELRLAESVILGLRLEEGVDIADVNEEFGTNILDLYKKPITDMIAAGLLEQDNGSLKLTRRGMLLSNEVFWRLLPEKVATQ